MCYNRPKNICCSFFSCANILNMMDELHFFLNQIFPNFNSKWPKSEEFGIFRGGLVPFDDFFKDKMKKISIRTWEKILDKALPYE